MTAVDDLKVGMYVAVTDCELPSPEPTFGIPYWYTGEMEQRRQSRAVSNGMPLEVLAISLPFLCVTDGKRRFSVDVRETRLQRLSRQYVQAMAGGQDQDFTATRRRRKKKSKPDPKKCPRCGSRRVERLVAPGEWSLYCQQCGLADAPPIPRE